MSASNGAEKLKASLAENNPPEEKNFPQKEVTTESDLKSSTALPNSAIQLHLESRPEVSSKNTEKPSKNETLKKFKPCNCEKRYFFFAQFKDDKKLLHLALFIFI